MTTPNRGQSIASEKRLGQFPQHPFRKRLQMPFALAALNPRKKNAKKTEPLQPIFQQQLGRFQWNGQDYARLRITNVREMRNDEGWIGDVLQHFRADDEVELSALKRQRLQSIVKEKLGGPALFLEETLRVL